MRPLLSEIDIPTQYVCPISCQIMKDPVITPDGHTYERKKIERWLRSRQTDPQTRKPLTIQQLVPNRGLKDAIEAFMAAQVKIQGKKAQTPKWTAEQEGLRTAARVQAKEADGFALDSTLRCSQLEYERDQLLDWAGVHESQRSRLKSQLSQLKSVISTLQKANAPELDPEEEHKLEKSLYQINRKLEDSPYDARFINTKVRLLRDLNQYTEALQVVNVGLSQEPDNIYLLTARGNVLGRIGEIPAALKDFKTVERIQPKNEYALVGQLVLFKMMGQRKKCQKVIQKLIAQGSTYGTHRPPSSSTVTDRSSGCSTTASTPTPPNCHSFFTEVRHYHSSNHSRPVDCDRTLNQCR